MRSNYKKEDRELFGFSQKKEKKAKATKPASKTPKKKAAKTNKKPPKTALKHRAKDFFSEKH